MSKKLRYVAAVLLFPAIVAVAEDKPAVISPASAPVAAPVAAPEAPMKVMSGMSVVGNGDETPKSLYIVPWKTSEVGNEVTFASSISNDEFSPVDKSDFIHQLDFYRKSNPN